MNFVRPSNVHGSSQHRHSNVLAVYTTKRHDMLKACLLLLQQPNPATTPIHWQAPMIKLGNIMLGFWFLSFQSRKQFLHMEPWSLISLGILQALQGSLSCSLADLPFLALRRTFNLVIVLFVVFPLALNLCLCLCLFWLTSLFGFCFCLRGFCHSLTFLGHLHLRGFCCNLSFASHSFFGWFCWRHFRGIFRFIWKKNLSLRCVFASWGMSLGCTAGISGGLEAEAADLPRPLPLPRPPPRPEPLPLAFSSPWSPFFPFPFPFFASLSALMSAAKPNWSRRERTSKGISNIGYK